MDTTARNLIAVLDRTLPMIAQPGPLVPHIARLGITLGQRSIAHLATLQQAGKLNAEERRAFALSFFTFYAAVRAVANPDDIPAIDNYVAQASASAPERTEPVTIHRRTTEVDSWTPSKPTSTASR